MIRGFVVGIPKEIEEAAWIDGCTYMQAFFRIIFPVALPGIVSTAMLAFMFSWNELLFALTIAGDKIITLPVFMSTHYHGYIAVSYGQLSASGIIAVIPTVVFIILVQKNIVRGLSFGAIK
jgi:multiple sugar transport system permease protein